MDTSRSDIRRVLRTPDARGARRPRRPAAAAGHAAAASLTVVALGVLLAGCGPTGTDAPPETTAPAATTPAPSTEMPPASDTPTGSADRPLEAIDAYALCRAQTFAYYEGDFGLLEYAPFADATVLERDDGAWFVYIEVDDGNRTPDLVESAGSECIVGGTIGEPEWQSFGVISRDVAEESIADYNRPPEQP